jgi:hypothetical protein
MSDKQVDPSLAKKAEDAVLAWLRGELDRIECVRTDDGNEHVMQWERADDR